jgi:hypothetical protein
MVNQGSNDQTTDGWKDEDVVSPKTGEQPIAAVEEQARGILEKPDEGHRAQAGADADQDSNDDQRGDFRELQAGEEAKGAMLESPRPA